MKLAMKTYPLHSLVLFALLPLARAQGTVPTFEYSVGNAKYVLMGGEPVRGGSTTIPVMLVPVRLVFEANKTLMDATPDIPRVLKSPVFSNFSFPGGGTTQYADAMLRTTFPKAEGWHTLLGKPEVKTVQIKIPLGYGYILTSKQSGKSFAIVDIEFLQKELFKQLPRQEGKLVIAMTHNTAYYALGDATVCCSWGTHGVDSASGNSFVLASYLHAAPAVVEDDDVQPLTQQLAEFVKDPLHDPLVQGGPQREGSGQCFPCLDASRFPARGRSGKLRRHRSRFHLLPSRADQYKREKQYPRIAGLCHRLFSFAERCVATLVYGSRGSPRRHV
jgi:hypothetical protein